MAGKFWGKKVFVKILGMGEWAPLFLVLSSPTPFSISPRGFHVEQAWHGLDRHGLDGQATGHRQATGQATDGTQAGTGNYQTDRSVN